MTIRSHVQAFDLGAKIILYELDVSIFGLGLIRMTPTTDDGGSAVGFGGQTYSPHPIRAEGFAMATGGPLPRPTFTVSNLDNSFTALVEQEDDLHGATLTRIRTYERYLDTGPEPDGNSHLPLDVFLLSRKAEHTDEQISWECAAPTDLEGVTLPARKVIRDYCGHDTRIWNPGTGVFDYSQATCPYTGTPRDENGAPCSGPEEVFSKRLGTCCQARFGTTAVLPTRAFPGVARLRSR